MDTWLCQSHVQVAAPRRPLANQELVIKNHLDIFNLLQWYNASDNNASYSLYINLHLKNDMETQYTNF